MIVGGLVFLAVIALSSAASLNLKCFCEEDGVYGWGEKGEFTLNAFEWEDDFVVCSRMCALAKQSAVGLRRAKRQEPVSVPVSQQGIAFNLGVGGIPSLPNGTPIDAPVPVPGYRHAINYNCVERCSAPQFHAPNCNFDCQRHGQFHDSIKVKAPPRAVATAPVLPPRPPPPPPQPLPIEFRPVFAAPPLAPDAGPFGGLFGGFGGAPFAGPAPFGGPGPIGFGGPIAGAPLGGGHPFSTLPLATGPGFSVATAPRPLVAPGPPVGPGPFGAWPHGGAGPLPGNPYNQVGLGNIFRHFPGAYRGHFGGQYGFGLVKK